ncbi:sigma factor-like helix-turn-helix DNA-binding protein [Streptomyces sp. NPDC058579]|uniref:sigma factor-like helix-turn-helix DNA-binding protein n=1 Tax=Streptomyces sp. NPDC058579 TaxID=3346548 RepID=UPI003668E444
MRHDDAARLRAIAYRMLGSFAEADDAVQAVQASGTEADADAGVARVCLERLRARESRRQDPWDPWATGEPREPVRGSDAVDPGLLAALDALTPAERVAFVLHDMFAVPIDRIAPVVDRTPAATRQLVSRAATRVQGTEEMPEPDLPRQREVVAALHAAAHDGDSDAVRALLDPEVLLRADAEAVRAGATTAHGAQAVSERLAELARTARPALVDGAAGLVGAGAGAAFVMALAVIDGRVTAVDVLMDPGHVGHMRVEVG